MCPSSTSVGRNSSRALSGAKLTDDRRILVGCFHGRPRFFLVDPTLHQKLLHGGDHAEAKSFLLGAYNKSLHMPDIPCEGGTVAGTIYRDVLRPPPLDYARSRRRSAHTACP